MALYYWISYRIHQNETSQDRYDDLIEAIDKATSGIAWDETTSFHMIASDLDIDALAARLKKAIDTECDKVVIRRVNNQQARYIGAISDTTTLKKFMSYAKRA